MNVIFEPVLFVTTNVCGALVTPSGLVLLKVRRHEAGGVAVKSVVHGDPNASTGNSVNFATNAAVVVQPGNADAFSKALAETGKSERIGLTCNIERNPNVSNATPFIASGQAWLAAFAAEVASATADPELPVAVGFSFAMKPSWSPLQPVSAGLMAPGVTGKSVELLANPATITFPRLST